MNNRLFKLHIYSYRYIYLVYITLALITSFLYYKVSYLDNILTVTNLLMIVSLFSIGIGYYEFSTIANSYLGLKINRPKFYWSTLLFGLFNLIIQTIVIFVFQIISDHKFIISIPERTHHYGLLIIFICLMYLIGSSWALFFQNSKIINKIIFAIIIIIIILLGTKIYEQVSLFINSLNSQYSSTTINLYSGFLLLFDIILIILNYIRFTKDY